MATKKMDVPQGFFYKESTHAYYLNGVKMTGVTTILSSAGNKDNLIQWAANQAAAGGIRHAFTNASMVRTFIADVSKFKKLDSTAASILDKKYPFFKAARMTYAGVRDDAADAGKEGHLICEMFERGDVLGSDWTPAGRERAQVYIDWYKEHVEKTYFVERPVFSSSLFVGGTPDGGFLLKDGKSYINDKKFKPYIYDPSPFWQMAAYRLMLEEMAEDTATPVRLEWKDGRVETYANPQEYLGSFGTVKWDGAVIVRVGEKSGDTGEYDFETMFCDTYESDKRGFLAALEIYRQMGDFKNTVKTTI